MAPRHKWNWVAQFFQSGRIPHTWKWTSTCGWISTLVASAARATHNELIRTFAETMGGAHHDASIDPNIEEAQKHFRIVVGSHRYFDSVAALLVHTAQTVLILIEAVLRTGHVAP